MHVLFHVDLTGALLTDQQKDDDDEPEFWAHYHLMSVASPWSSSLKLDYNGLSEPAHAHSAQMTINTHNAQALL